MASATMRRKPDQKRPAELKKAAGSSSMELDPAAFQFLISGTIFYLPDLAGAETGAAFVLERTECAPPEER
jgi:hypothetical protein